MKKTILTLLTVSLLSIVLIKCSTDDVLEVFIPNISNQWESDRNTKFFFVASQDSVSASAFTGSEQNENFENFDLEGSFNRYDVEFTFVDGPEDGVKYTGQFIKNSNPLRMRVKGTNGVTLNITQVP